MSHWEQWLAVFLLVAVIGFISDSIEKKLSKVLTVLYEIRNEARERRH